MQAQIFQQQLQVILPLYHKFNRRTMLNRGQRSIFADELILNNVLCHDWTKYIYLAGNFLRHMTSNGGHLKNYKLLGAG